MHQLPLQEKHRQQFLLQAQMNQQQLLQLVMQLIYQSWLTILFLHLTVFFWKMHQNLPLVDF
ncbi:hypothetical protein A1353_14355 [Methylomonas methanica]|uniref:Uncharacterized protein n=1 Tax=Methylomonas methanica TaxID=421 RepID=A0A177MCN5_METMH|nr:hypothetical protein A1353_14355 [Methylomonas methanica]